MLDFIIFADSRISGNLCEVVNIALEAIVSFRTEEGELKAKEKFIYLMADGRHNSHG